MMISVTNRQVVPELNRITLRVFCKICLDFPNTANGERRSTRFVSVHEVDH